MGGLLIYESSGQVYSFVMFDDSEYDFVEPLIKKTHHVYFGKSKLNLNKLQNSREKIAQIVKDLNNKQKVDVKKELSDLFN